MGHILMNGALSRNYYLRLEITEKPSLLDDICLSMYIYIHVLYDPHISFGWEKTNMTPGRTVTSVGMMPI